MVLLKKIKLQLLYYSQLNCDNAVTPNFYGLPKINKSDVLLGHIVSFIGAPTHRLAKFLVGILSPLLSMKYTAQN